MINCTKEWRIDALNKKGSIIREFDSRDDALKAAKEMKRDGYTPFLLKRFYVSEITGKCFYDVKEAL